MERIKIPETVLKLAERHGVVVIEKVEFENHLSLTSDILSAAFRMYDAIEQIGKLDAGGSSAGAVAIAKAVQTEIDQRFWPLGPPGR